MIELTLRVSGAELVDPLMSEEEELFLFLEKFLDTNPERIVRRVHDYCSTGDLCNFADQLTALAKKFRTTAHLEYIQGA